ncbi:MAG: NTP transferase domain-containing protein [Firmicutes bacterium]|nr:NTP transferase domain-containing protein [Bacillota bacterium]
MSGFTSIVLAAGMGTRMRSDFPKVLHPLCGVPMIEHVIDALTQAGAARIVVVVGHRAEHVQATVGDRVEYVYQAEQKGTGHAVMQTAGLLQGTKGPILITYGDAPLYRPETFRDFVAAHVESGAAGSILTAIVDDATGYGRIVRSAEGQFVRVVEQRDATPEEAAIREFNTGTYCIQGDKLFEGLAALTPDNAQGEYYLPDVLTWLKKRGLSVRIQVLDDADEARGINDRKQLAEAEAIMRQRIREYWMERGVTIVDPATTWIDKSVQIGQDTILFPGTLLEGDTVVGRRCRIGPFACVRSARIGDDSVIDRSNVEDVDLPAGSAVGPGTHHSIGPSQARCAWLFARANQQ